MAAANAQLHNAREERDQFDEANDQIIEHLKTKVQILSFWFATSDNDFIKSSVVLVILFSVISFHYVNRKMSCQNLLLRQG